MTNKEAIEILTPELEQLFLGHGYDLLTENSTKFMQALDHALEILEKFDDAVEVEHKRAGFIFNLNDKAIASTSTHKFYAIPKEQD